MPRITLSLRQDERDALGELALSELRTPREQARHLVCQELRRHSLLEGQTDREIPTSSQTERRADTSTGELLEQLSKYAVVESRVLTTADGTVLHVTLVSPSRGKYAPGEDTEAGSE